MPAPDSPDGHWFEPIAEHLGEAYLRYSFTRGTDNEVDFLIGALGLEPGMRVLDVGCGPGRHAHAMARRGIDVVGVDISERFIELASRHAPNGASFVRADARQLAYHEEFDAAISLCQGAFGLTGGPGGMPLVHDVAILEGMRDAVRPGGRVGVSAFSAYFQVRWMEDHDEFDAATGVNREHTEVLDGAGVREDVDLWTTCYTPRELVLLAERVGLTVDELWSVTPGRYGEHPPDLNQPEFLVLAHRSPSESVLGEFAPSADL